VSRIATLAGERPARSVGRPTSLTAQEVLEIRGAVEQLRRCKERVARLRRVYGRGVVDRAMRPDLYKWVR
jgi:hypothetical protein